MINTSMGLCQNNIRRISGNAASAWWPSQRVTIQRVSCRLGASGEPVRICVRQGGVQAGLRPGVSKSENPEIRRLKKEVAELRRASEILRTASCLLPAELDRPASRCSDKWMYLNQFGFELIHRVLGNTAGGSMTSHGYRRAKSRPMSDQAVCDQVLGEEMQLPHAKNHGVHGVTKMYYLMRRKGLLLGGDQVARVMKTQGIADVKRGKHYSRRKQRQLIRIRPTS